MDASDQIARGLGVLLLEALPEERVEELRQALEDNDHKRIEALMLEAAQRISER